MESFEDFGLKIYNYTCLNEYMNVVHKRVDPGLSSYFDHFKHLLKGACLIVTKFHIGPQRVEGAKKCSYHSGLMTNMATRPIFVKNL